MNQTATASIIVNNYNYAPFLGAAIDSALAQTDSSTEVIVVDDGSTDRSREIIAGYGSRIAVVLKENAGQASAFNAGLAASSSAIVLFLDADDVLLPTAVQRVRGLLADPAVAKVHWPLRVIDAEGNQTGKTWPVAKLPDGDFRAQVAACGPGVTVSPPTSGNAWARWFLERVMPIPQAFGLCADEYLFTLAPGLGLIRAVSEPQGCYRFHGENRYQQLTMEERIAAGLAVADKQCAVLAAHFRDAGIPVDVDAWRGGLWFPQPRRAVEEMLSALPTGSRFILIDEDQWGTPASISGRERLPFTQRNGAYWGPPADDAAAIAELEALHAQGAEYVVVAKAAAWWMDHYVEFARYLRSRFRLTFESERMQVFDLRVPAGSR